MKDLLTQKNTFSRLDDAQLINSRQLAELLGVSPSTVYQRALTNGGPPIIRVSNKRPRYRVGDVRAWMASLQDREG